MVVCNLPSDRHHLSALYALLKQAENARGCAQAAYAARSTRTLIGSIGGGNNALKAAVGMQRPVTRVVP